MKLMKRIIFIATLVCILGLSLHAAVFQFTLDMDGTQAFGTSTGTGGDLHQNDPADFPMISYDTGLHELRIPIGWGSANGFNDLEGTMSVSSPPILHGPALAGANASGLYTLQPFTIQNVHAGSLDLTLTLHDDPNGPYTLSQQESDLQAGLWYVTVATGDFGSPEIRGQLAPVPEPKEYAMAAGIALLGFGIYRRYKLSIRY